VKVEELGLFLEALLCFGCTDVAIPGTVRHTLVDVKDRLDAGASKFLMNANRAA
jgi:hypothetical protein